MIASWLLHPFCTVGCMGPGVDPHLDLEAIQACDASSLSEADAVAVLHRSRRLRGRLDAFDAAVTARLAELHATGNGAPAADVLSRNGKLSAAEARLRERRGKLLTKTPAFGEALAHGRVAAEHADALASATLRLDDTITTELFARERELVDHASHHSPEEFARYTRDLIARIERDHGTARAEQQRQDTRLSIRTENDGMTVLNGRFHPELGERITTAIQTETRALLASSEHLELDHQQAAAVALSNLVGSGNQATRPGSTDALIVVDLDTLRHGLHEHSVCETGNGAALSVEATRRLCCGRPHHPRRARRRRGRARLRPPPTTRQPRTTQRTARDVPHLHVPRLRHRLRPV
jgi:hypothetical protein